MSDENIFADEREFRAKFQSKIYICPRCKNFSENPYWCKHCLNQSNNFYYKNFKYKILETGLVNEIFPPIESLSEQKGDYING